MTMTDDTNPLDSMPLADLRLHAQWNADNAALCEQIEAEIARREAAAASDCPEAGCWSAGMCPACEMKQASH